MAEANKKPNFFVRTGRAIAKWFREMKSELKKVVWPDGKQLFNNTLIVLASVLVVGVIVCLFDFLAGKGIALLKDLFL
ncbi:MAG: preprotein translocase subunit SecE [Oscillospiraceae bacterium]|nr:preprotein translocase subunit SecE [Oscillospiraceae bacterium]